MAKVVRLVTESGVVETSAGCERRRSSKHTVVCIGIQLSLIGVVHHQLSYAPQIAVAVITSVVEQKPG